MSAEKIEEINIEGYQAFVEKTDTEIDAILKRDGVVFVQDPSVSVKGAELYTFEVTFKDELKDAILFLNSLYSFLEHDNFNCYINDHKDGYVIMFLFNEFSVSGFRTLLSNMVSDTIEEVEIKETMKKTMRLIVE